ncbi:MAG: hypothetical protein JRF42_10150 [Deltaproteobacteria bacterium]|nr:hypothetical protein [Deltaproteobacteria bacterium]
MTERFVLKSISTDAIERSVERAEHYRLLNDPEQAESICLDILAVDPTNGPARITLILSLTDQFQQGGGSHGVRRAKEHLARLPGEYERAYYEGLHEAMQHYEQADALKPVGVDDAILRWNACVRTIERESLQPRHDEPELPLE